MPSSTFYQEGTCNWDKNDIIINMTVCHRRRTPKKPYNLVDGSYTVGVS
ncbi:MAG: hypothetical protein ACE5OY_01270 [Candidatus Bathyarchaeia archaeon]